MDSSPSPLAVVLDQLRRRGLRGVKRLIRPLWMRRLDRRNRDSREPFLDAAGPVVSLTTFGSRLSTVHYTIESIAAGRCKPSRLLLWVAEDELRAGIPATLQRLVARGLEVRACADLLSHKKYFPAVNLLPADRPLVTADDDVLYPRGWLAGLVAAAARAPDEVHCYRAHEVTFTADGQFAPYIDWPGCRSTEPSHHHFFTGVAGVLYPSAVQRALRDAGDAFLICCPRADDIWLNAVAWRSGAKVRQLSPFHPVLFELPGTRDSGLARANVQGGGNDRQLADTFSATERQALRQAG